MTNFLKTALFGYLLLLAGGTIAAAFINPTGGLPLAIYSIVFIFGVPLLIYSLIQSTIVCTMLWVSTRYFEANWKRTFIILVITGSAAWFGWWIIKTIGDGLQNSKSLLFFTLLFFGLIVCWLQAWILYRFESANWEAEEV